MLPKLMATGKNDRKEKKKAKKNVYACGTGGRERAAIYFHHFSTLQISLLCHMHLEREQILL